MHTSGCTMLLLYIIFGLISFSHEFIPEYIGDKNLSEDGRLNFTELCKKYGHHAEALEVVTDDGYILTLFHISGKKKPILIMHGLYDSADTWVIRGQNSLAITLADKDHDVWIGNVRGSRYSRRHTILNPDTDERFWDFSFTEMGLYDWAAMIDTILEKTNETKVNAIGHSQGTTSFYALMSSRPEYNDKINLFIGMAPITNYENSLPPLPRVAAPVILKTLQVLGIRELFADHSSAVQLIKLFCTKEILTEALCELGLFAMAGFDPTGIDPEFLPTLFGHFPAGTSRKSIAHLEQLALTGKFAEFNHGLVENLRIYRSISPPEFDLSNVMAKCALLYGDNDAANSIDAVRRLKSELPNVVYSEKIAKKGWNHIDFNWGSDMTVYLFPRIFNLLDKYDW